MGCALYYPACAAADDNADKSAGDADEDSLDEELRQNIHSSGAHTHAQTDFAGTFRYGYIHDVHDADTAYYQRYACDTGEESGHQVGGGVQHRAELLLAAYGEIVVVAVFQFMVTAQNPGDFLGGVVRHVLGEGGCEDTLQISLCKQTLHHGGVGSEHHIILVHAHAVVTFGFQYARHTERHLVEADNTSYGVFSVGEKIVLYRLADDAYFGGSLYVGFRKHRAVVHRKLADFEVVRTYAVYGRGVVVVARYELSRRGYVGADGRQEVRFVAQGFVVGELQRLHGAGVLPYAAAHVRSRMNHYHIRAHFGDLLLDALL